MRRLCGERVRACTYLRALETATCACSWRALSVGNCLTIHNNSITVFLVFETLPPRLLALARGALGRSRLSKTSAISSSRQSAQSAIVVHILIRQDSLLAKAAHRLLPAFCCANPCGSVFRARSGSSPTLSTIDLSSGEKIQAGAASGDA